MDTEPRAASPSSSASMPPLPDASIRIPGDLVADLDALIPRVQANRQLSALLGRVTRASVLRLVLVRGIEAVKAECPAPPTG